MAAFDTSEETLPPLRLQLPLSVLQEPALGSDERISLLCSLPPDQLSKRGGGFSLNELQIMAQKLNISKHQSKDSLILAIQSKYQNRSTMETIEEEQAYVHRKVPHTFPRFLGFLMADPDGLARSRTLASRSELQLRETNGSNPLYVEATKRFNSAERGVAIPGSTLSETDNVKLTSYNLDTSFIPQGELSSPKAFNMLKEVQRRYAKHRANWEKSGTHDTAFSSFCGDDSDVLVLHLWLQHIGDPDLSRFMAEGTKIAGGLDTGRNPDQTVPTTPVIRPNKRERTEEALVEELRLKRIQDGEIAEVLKAKAKADMTSAKMRQLEQLLALEERLPLIADPTRYDFMKAQIDRLYAEIGSP